MKTLLHCCKSANTEVHKGFSVIIWSFLLTPFPFVVGKVQTCWCWLPKNTQLHLTLFFQLFNLFFPQIELICEARRRIKSSVGLIEVHLSENTEPLQSLMAFIQLSGRNVQREEGVFALGMCVCTLTRWWLQAYINKSHMNKWNGFSNCLVIAGLPGGQMLGLPAAQPFFSTPPSPSWASRALLSTWPSPLKGRESSTLLLLLLLLHLMWNVEAHAQPVLSQ